ncbi:unnamed protein product, partial [Brachionus calyciflorus]
LDHLLKSVIESHLLTPKHIQNWKSVASQKALDFSEENTRDLFLKDLVIPFGLIKIRRGIGNNLVFDGENGTFDEFEAAFKYDCIIYNWNDAQKIEAFQIFLTGKAKKLFEQMTETDKASIKLIFEKLNRGCVIRTKLSNWRSQNHTNYQTKRSSEPNRNYFNSQSNLRIEQQGHMIKAEIEVDSDEYQETNLIECQNIVYSKKSKLVRIESNVELFGQDLKVKFLADSGSRASFIGPDSLPKSLSDKIENFIKSGKHSKRF